MSANVSRFICIHGHFYQPPRENPWIETVEIQESAAPYHDWNTRINAECYAPNARARILDDAGLLCDVVNNYAWMSFNFGPTLLSWLEEADPETYARILEGDRESGDRWGHGNALAQVYNHMIMPLANARDRETQIRWGVADFQRRFQRDPEGMWLPETACDDRTVADLIRHGIRFIILEPGQADRIRPLDGGDWIDTGAKGLDGTRPYRCFARSESGDVDRGQYLDIFFYDGPISRAVSFEDLLRNGEQFTQRLTEAFRDDRDHAQLVHIATDGESYGHHKMFGDMALAYVLRRGIPSREDCTLTNYGAFLEAHPPTWEVVLSGGVGGGGTSWSCVHGVGRWQGDCGCHTGGEPGWNQRWRQPVRDGFDLLRGALYACYEQYATPLFRDIREARNRYIDVVLDRRRESVAAFLKTVAHRTLSPEEQSTAIQLLEMQRYALLMYTSCAWFFSDLEGIETRQILAYAARSLELGRQISGHPALGADGLSRLAEAVGNRLPRRSGRELLEAVLPEPDAELHRIVNHFAVTALFAESPELGTTLFHYRLDVETLHQWETDLRVLLVGTVRVRPGVLLDDRRFHFVSLFAGGRFRTWIHPAEQMTLGQTFQNRLFADFKASELQCVAWIETMFGTRTWRLRDVYRDERRHLLQRLLQHHITGWRMSHAELYESTKAIVRNARAEGLEVPEEFRIIASSVLARRFQDILAQTPVARAETSYDQAFQQVLREAREFDLDMDQVFPAHRVAAALTDRIAHITRTADPSAISAVQALLRFLRDQHVTLDLARAQVRLFRDLREGVLDIATLEPKTVAAVQALVAALGIQQDAVRMDTGD